MYETGDLLPVGTIPEGSVVLVSGPAMVGKHDLVVRLLAAGLDREEGCLAVTTDRTASEMGDELAVAAGRDLSGEPVGFVEATGTTEDGQSGDTVGVPVETVGSPTDLTGIGIALSTQLERLAGSGRPTRVGFLSLSTLLLYNDPERVAQFMHVLRQRIVDAGAVALLAVNEEAVGETVAAQLDSFADAEVRLRDRPEGTQARVQGFGGVDTDWVPIQSTEPTRDDGPSGARGPTPVEPSIGSIAELVDRVESEQSTLTLLEYTGDAATLSSIEAYFGRLNVDVRTADLDANTPTDVALLHRGEDFLAGAPVTDLAAAIQVADDPEVVAAGTATTGLLDAVDRTVFEVDGLDRQLLVQASHAIESLARRVGEGRLHAGFQRLSRLTGDERARRVYDRLAETDVDVHVYGRPDATVEDDRLTVHDRADEEIERTWFLSFVGPDARAGVLVAIERGAEYRGFWSYRRDLAAELDGYLA